MIIKKFRVEPGQEVINAFKDYLKSVNIKNGVIVSLIGAVDNCCISNMPKANAKDDILTEYHEPLEMSGSGEIVDGKPHIHCVLGREGDSTLSGHLHWAKVETWFVHIYYASLD
jgi:predicted DNA-binding protein with PD1-like motif